MKNYEGKKIPKTKWVNFAIQQVTRSSAEAGKVIEKYGSVKEAYNELHNLLDKDVNDRIAYHIAVEKNGTAQVHQNKMREGVIFNDPVGIKAATANELTLQWYPRNTGEMLIDVAAPIYVKGEHFGAIRMAVIPQSKKTMPLFLTLVVANGMFPLAIQYILDRHITLSSLGLWSVLLAVTIWMYKEYFIEPVKELESLAGSLVKADISRIATVKKNDEMGQTLYKFNSVVVFLREIISAIMNDSKQVANTGQMLSVNTDESARVVTQVASAIQEIATGNTEQSKNVAETIKVISQLGEVIEHIAIGAQEQASSVNKVSSTVSQMASAIGEVASNAQHVLDATLQTTEVAKNGTQAVLDTVTGMGKIKDKVYETAEKIKELGEHSQQIGEIIEVIDDIAEQTNLLALNAAIEAARAGEHGKGFAVVADEVRKLAERSSTATKEIAVLITNIQKGTDRAVVAMEEGTEEVEQGVNLATSAGKALDEILKTVNEVLDQVRNISAAAQQVAASSNEVVKSIENVAAIVEENTAATEQMAASSEQANSSINQISEVSARSAAASEEVSASTEEMTTSVEEIASSVKTMAQMAENLSSLVTRFKV